MKVMVGMSGGVDSSAAATLLKSEYETAGVTLRLIESEKLENECRDAASVCQKLGIPHFTADFSAEFSRFVIDNFISEYKSGRTPNPCIQCNRHIKFGAMLQFARDKGYEKIATGHYARVESSGGRYYIKKAADISKDQSYVLYTLSQEQLSSLVLPLGGYTKAQIRAIAEEQGLITARKSDSQDICFVPDGDYARFICERTGESFPSGEYVDINGAVLGEHKGIINYTIGQRKGLGIALGKPAFVLSKDAVCNRVVLGEEEGLFYHRVEVENINLQAAESVDNISAAAKLRYSQGENPCRIHLVGENRAILEFDTPQRAPSAGQAAVFYDGDIVLGGGTIVGGIK